MAVDVRDARFVFDMNPHSRKRLQYCTKVGHPPLFLIGIALPNTVIPSMRSTDGHDYFLAMHFSLLSLYCRYMIT